MIGTGDFTHPGWFARIREQLVEAELFGHTKGAFTGALENRSGKLEMADNGTLFLDDIDLLDINMQARLLRVLQEKEYEKVGSDRVVNVDIKFIAASNKDLQQLVAKGKFREDLFYRISEIPLEIPPLREREGDVIVLARFFFEKFNEDHGRKLRGFSKEALAAMENKPLPQPTSKKVTPARSGTRLTTEAFALA